jgi:hypothetical protein
MESPIKLAESVVEVMRHDPVMAAQIREYIPVRELLQLLGIALNETTALPTPEGQRDLFV